MNKTVREIAIDSPLSSMSQLLTNVLQLKTKTIIASARPSHAFLQVRIIVNANSRKTAIETRSWNRLRR
ncbi:MAG: hypothetical protein JW384_03105 [Nitrosomonadaceae bacterium]|nr:hypothetical protein [Nitrosomonadaceae bacterium]